VPRREGFDERRLIALSSGKSDNSLLSPTQLLHCAIHVYDLPPRCPCDYLRQRELRGSHVVRLVDRMAVQMACEQGGFLQLHLKKIHYAHPTGESHRRF
jgi:hypothetical protein